MSFLGDKLRELRGSFSLYEVGKELGMERTQLQRYENGQMPTAVSLKKIASYYEVCYRELRKLYFEDLFVDTEERSIVFEWVEEHLRKARAKQNKQLK